MISLNQRHFPVCALGLRASALVLSAWNTPTQLLSSGAQATPGRLGEPCLIAPTGIAAVCARVCYFLSSRCCSEPAFSLVVFCFPPECELLRDRVRFRT